MKGIRIISKRDGFRRAGIEHHGTREYPRDRFSEAEITALKRERLLVVQEFEFPDPLPERPPETRLTGEAEDGGSAGVETVQAPPPTAADDDEKTGKGGKIEKADKTKKAEDTPPAS